MRKARHQPMPGPLDRSMPRINTTPCPRVNAGDRTRSLDGWMDRRRAGGSGLRLLTCKAQVGRGREYQRGGSGCACLSPEGAVGDDQGVSRYEANIRADPVR